MDTNGDGKLNKKEIYDGYKQYLGYEMSNEEIDKLFLKVDLDKSNKIDYSEFIMATINEKAILCNNKL